MRVRYSLNALFMSATIVGVAAGLIGPPLYDSYVYRRSVSLLRAGGATVSTGPLDTDLIVDGNQIRSGIHVYCFGILDGPMIASLSSTHQPIDLTLEQVAITPQLMQRISELSRLHTLRFVKYDFTVQPKLLDVLCRNKYVENLIFIECPVDREVALHIPSQVKRLQLLYCKLSSLRILSPRLAVLNIYESTITSSAIQDLGQLTRLVKLTYDGGEAQIEVVVGVADAIAQLRKLRVLSLRYSTITENAAKAIAQMQWLNELYISSSSCTQSVLEYLRQSLPNTKVFAVN